MPLPTGMSLQCGGAKALGKTGLGGGGVLEGRWKVAGRVAGRVQERCWKGFQRWKGPLEGSAGRGSCDGRGVPAGFQPGVPVQKGIPVGVPAGVPASIVSPVSPAFRPLSGYTGCLAAIGTAGRVGGRAACARGQCGICGGQRVGRVVGPRGGDLANECSSEAGGRGRAHVPAWSNAVVQGSEAQCGDSEPHEGGVHVSGASEKFARQEASRVHVWRWKRAAPILVIPDVP